MRWRRITVDPHPLPNRYMDLRCLTSMPYWRRSGHTGYGPPSPNHYSYSVAQDCRQMCQTQCRANLNRRLRRHCTSMATLRWH
jgi:hypothetical protein